MITEEDTSYIKLSIEERCVHKLWKARLSGYEEAAKFFAQLDDKSPEWNQFTGIIDKFVIDSNVVAQEKGLEATLVFVDNSANAGSTAENVMTGLITKCYGATKKNIRDIAVEITLMFIEIEKQDVVVEELVKGMENKFPKIVANCIKTATQAIKEFGPKVLCIKPLLKKLQTLLEDKDKSVRHEAKLLAIEIYSWIGPTPVKANLTYLKPLQIQELEGEFQKINDIKRRPTRFLRSQQEHVDEMEVAYAAIGGAGEVDNHEDYIDSVDILCQLNSDFYENLNSKVWQERKKALEELGEILARTPLLANGDYGDLLSILEKIIEHDLNVITVSDAAKCIELLANGLKKKFETYASTCLKILLKKFKEKKRIIILSLRDAIDAIYLTVTLESIYEDILMALNDTNSSVRAESILFLSRCFTKCTPTILNENLLKIFTTALVKTLNESDSTVQDNSVEALGIAWKVVSENNILPFMDSVDAIKLIEIKKVAENTVITAV